MSALEELELFEKNNNLENELRQAKKENKELKKEIKKITNKRKKLSIGLASFMTIVSVAAGSMAHSLYSDYKMIREGKDEIANNVYESCMDGIGWQDYSDGLKFNIGKNYVDYDEFLSTIRLRARSCEISDIDLYIGISSIINRDIAEDLVGDIAEEDVKSRAYEVYLDSEMESVRANGK